MVRIGGVKQYADGSISERTAWLAEPYMGMPTTTTGSSWVRREKLYQTRARRARGIATGDSRQRRARHRPILGVYEQISDREFPRRDPRFRIEHCTVVTDALIARMRAVGRFHPVCGLREFSWRHAAFLRRRTGRPHVRVPILHRRAASAAVLVGLHGEPSGDPMLWLYSETTRRDPPAMSGAGSSASAERGASFPDPQRRLCLVRGAQRARSRPGNSLTGGARAGPAHAPRSSGSGSKSSARCSEASGSTRLEFGGQKGLLAA